MCSLLKAKSTSKLTRQQDTRGAGSLSPCTTQAQDLSQRFPEGLVAISADSFKFLALLQHSFGPWAPPSSCSCRCWSSQSPAPAALARGVQAIPEPQHSAVPGCAAAELQPLQGSTGRKPSMCQDWWDAHPSRSGSLPSPLCPPPTSPSSELPAGTSPPEVTFTCRADTGTFAE